jgi:hypothetical protein
MKKLTIWERHPYRIRFLKPLPGYDYDRYCSNVLLVDDTLLAYRGAAMRLSTDYQAEVDIYRGGKWHRLSQADLDRAISAAKTQFRERAEQWA